jgi:AraC family transcriptional regulator of adaptative response/methylated-DNA-[protein]-cysteine methyltransferase
MGPPEAAIVFLDKAEPSEQQPLNFDWVDSPFGACLLFERNDSIAGLAFCEKDDEAAFNDLLSGLDIEECQAANLSAWASRLFGGQEKISVAVSGTQFQQQVWQALVDMSAGEVLSYSQLAERIGRPAAVRAVASAVAANPVAWLIPCHRIIRSSGETGEYRWGSKIKAAMLSAEKG